MQGGRHEGGQEREHRVWVWRSVDTSVHRIETLQCDQLELGVGPGTAVDRVWAGSHCGSYHCVNTIIEQGYHAVPSQGRKNIFFSIWIGLGRVVSAEYFFFDEHYCIKCNRNDAEKPADANAGGWYESP